MLPSGIYFLWVDSRAIPLRNGLDVPFRGAGKDPIRVLRVLRITFQESLDIAKLKRARSTPLVAIIVDTPFRSGRLGAFVGRRRPMNGFSKWRVSYL